MQYDLVELIGIITQMIGDWEIQFIREYEAEGLTARQIEYIDAIEKMGNPNLKEIAEALKLTNRSTPATPPVAVPMLTPKCATFVPSNVILPTLAIERTSSVATPPVGIEMFRKPPAKFAESLSTTVAGRS